MGRRFIILAATAALATPAVAGAESRAPSLSLPVPDPAAQALLQQSDYRIGPYDTLEITVFGVQDLTRTVQVDSAGQIAYPLIGDVPAAAKTPKELSQAIAAKLGARYLQSPDVTVLVKTSASQRITIEGAVESPGVYDITGRLTLLQAIAIAKGLDPDANPRRVVVFRLIDGRRMAGQADLEAVRGGAVDDPQIYAGDVIVVENSRTRAWLRTVLGTMPIFNLLRL